MTSADVTTPFTVADFEDNTGTCEECGETVTAVEEGSTPGFTGARTYWANLSCGHQWVDVSADNLEAVR